MNFKQRMKLAVFIVFGLTFANANAAFVDVTGDAVINGANGSISLQKANSSFFSLTFSDASKVESILYSDDSNTDVGNQSPANVGDVVQFEYDLASITEVDKAGNGNIQSNKGSFQYLAVHIGNDRELLFKFLLGIDEFEIDISRRNGGIANWRAYNGVPNAVPVPAAAWLFMSALTGLVGFGRKKQLAS